MLADFYRFVSIRIWRAQNTEEWWFNRIPLPPPPQLATYFLCLLTVSCPISPFINKWMPARYRFTLQFEKQQEGEEFTFSAITQFSFIYEMTPTLIGFGNFSILLIVKLSRRIITSIFKCDCGEECCCSRVAGETMCRASTLLVRWSSASVPRPPPPLDFNSSHARLGWSVGLSWTGI